jgi:hypothetical protein
MLWKNIFVAFADQKVFLIILSLKKSQKKTLSCTEKIFHKEQHTIDLSNKKQLLLENKIIDEYHNGKKTIKARANKST